MATISPRRTSRSTSRSTCSRPAPDLIELVEAADGDEAPLSLKAQRLHRIEPRRLTRRIDRRQEADHDGRHHDRGKVQRLDDERDVGDLIDVLRDADQP